MGPFCRSAKRGCFLRFLPSWFYPRVLALMHPHPKISRENRFWHYRALIRNRIVLISWSQTLIAILIDLIGRRVSFLEFDWSALFIALFDDSQYTLYFPYTVENRKNWSARDIENFSMTSASNFSNLFIRTAVIAFFCRSAKKSPNQLWEHRSHYELIMLSVRREKWTNGYCK